MKITQIISTSHKPYAVYARQEQAGNWVPVACPVLCWALESDMLFDKKSGTHYPGFKIAGMVHRSVEEEDLTPASEFPGFLGYAESLESYEETNTLWRNEAKAFGKKVSESS